MPARRPTIALLALALAAALTLTALAATAAVPRPGASAVTAASDLPPIRRTVVWYGVPQASPRNLHIDSSSVNAPSPDEFQISYATGNFTLVYQRTAGGPVTNQYTLNIRGLVEWNDTSGNGNFEDGTVVAYTPLGPSAFGRYPIQHFETNTSDGVGMNSFLIPSNKGDVALNLTIADGFVRLPSGQTLTPMEAKLTLEINHTMALPGTRLALQFGVNTAENVTLESQSWDDLNSFSTDDHALNVSNPGSATPSSAFFAWSNTASVNGVSGPVLASGPAENATTGDYDLYLSYTRPASSGLQLHIVHDPALGVVSAAYLSSLHPPPGPSLPFQGDVIVYAVSLVAIAVLVAGTALLVNRRRKLQR